MTKEQFIENEQPLAVIVSVNTHTGKTLYDTYNWIVAESFRQDYEEDFPDMLHFITYNKAAIKERRKKFGLPD